MNNLYSIASFASDNGIQPDALQKRMDKIKVQRVRWGMEEYDKHQLAIEAVGQIKTQRKGDWVYES